MKKIILLSILCLFVLMFSSIVAAPPQCEEQDTKCIYFGPSQGGPAWWVQTCSGGVWRNSYECDHGCENGACIGEAVCGNNVVSGSEECDGDDDSACPDLCSPDCTCEETSQCEDQDTNCIYFGPNQGGPVWWVQTCSNGIWVNSYECDHGCENGACIGEAVCDPNVNLISNGGFEFPALIVPWDIVQDGNPNLKWNVIWEDSNPGASTSYGGYTRPEAALKEIHNGVNGWLSYSGDQYAELDTDWFGPGTLPNGEPASVRISQDIDTMSGYYYLITFAYSPRPNTGTNENKLEVKWDGSSILPPLPDPLPADGTGNSNTAWQTYYEYATASSGTTKLEFADKGTANSLGTFLDEVSVRCIGECLTDGDCLPGYICGQQSVQNGITGAVIVYDDEEPPFNMPPGPLLCFPDGGPVPAIIPEFSTVGFIAMLAIAGVGIFVVMRKRK